jgi:mono/diheme cytochrome c family protein
MQDLSGHMVLAADVQKVVGYTLAIILTIGFAIAVALNMRKGRKEVGSEVELAANRKPYYDDDTLETRKLDRTLQLGLLTLVVIAVALPLYWLAEPGRQDDRVEGWNDTFVKRGEELYNEGANCAACHGPEGTGGAATYTLTAPNGDFVASVSWQAPALDTVLYRYSREEVTFILNYGRGFSPMPAWGELGGGPLTTQQIANIVDYLQSIQLPPNENQEQVQKEIDETCAPDDAGICTLPDARFETLGEAIFNMGLYTKFAGGAYSCGRCHTKGWSYGEPQVAGGGAFGPNLTGGSELRQFPTKEQQIEFVSLGGIRGRAYGVNGLSGAGQMPGFGFNPNAVVTPAPGPTVFPMDPGQVMLTQDQIDAVVEYERGL